MNEIECMMDQQPDWSQAPSWAKWWAVNAGGVATWYETEPNRMSTEYSTMIGSTKIAAFYGPEGVAKYWQYSLVARGRKFYKVMEKPDWTKAPEWANWWCYDRSGAAWWSQEKPRLETYGWSSVNTPNRSERAAWVNAVWAAETFGKSLQERPVVLDAEPDWATAPTWAKYFAINASGRSVWWQSKPLQRKNVWYVNKAEETAYGPEYPVAWATLNWRNSLRERPQATKSAYTPAWDKAPVWARYCAVGQNGTVSWFEYEPGAKWTPKGMGFWEAIYGLQQEYTRIYPYDNWTEQIWRRDYPQAVNYDFEPLALDRMTDTVRTAMDTYYNGVRDEILLRDEMIRELSADLANAKTQIGQLQEKLVALQEAAVEKIVDARGKAERRFPYNAR